MVNAISVFFSTGALGDDINDTIVALTPKIPHPEAISQLRLISCCNFIYKTISKILVSRLKPLLSDLISPQQSAFVGGRLIQDNLVVVQEAFHFLKKRSCLNKFGFAIKLDMNKTYDRVDWSFLKNVLLSYGFSVDWVFLVMSLVTSVKYMFQVNGSRSRVIILSRGLRQGGPLSPYLFILVFDVLSRLISQACLVGNIFGLSLATGAPTLTHLFFCMGKIILCRCIKLSTSLIFSLLLQVKKSTYRNLALSTARVYPLS